MTARRIILFSSLSLVLAAGCHPRRTHDPAGDRPVKPTRVGLFNRDLLNAQIEPPPGITDELIVPLRGEELSRARLKLSRVLNDLPRPAYLDAPIPAPEDADAPPPEPPLAAQLAYVQARNAWRDNQPAQTKLQLENALRLAPNEPILLRLLGEVYTRTGNRVKGAHYFRQAVELEPDDARSVYILGRFAIEKGDHDEAIVLFHDALTKARDDEALAELAHHFLGNALRSTGYVAAAIQQFQQYVELTGTPVQASRLARDQVLLRRQIGVTRQLLGDLNMLMGRPAEALQAYHRALEDGVSDPIKLDKRRVYAALMSRDADLARRLVIDMVQRQHGDAQSLAMVRYVVNQGVNAAAIAKALRGVYESQGRPPELAIATADVLPDEQAKPC